MNCHQCGAWSIVLLTRAPRRRRECANGHRFTTRETYEDTVTTTHLTPAELAERWRLGPGTLANWRAKGRGPAYIKLGDKARNKVLYPIQAVEAYEQSGVHLPTREGAP